MHSWKNEFLIGSLFLILGIAVGGYFLAEWLYWIYLFVLPIIALGLYDIVQKKHAIMRNYPVLGRGRYILEDWRPKLYQYFIESDTNGTPVSRIFRSVVYQRAKQELDTSPFGTQLNVYEEGYEWMPHSMAPLDPHHIEHDPRVTIGGSACLQPYSASIFNVSAMSFGSLSSNAIQALNGGARIGNFAHNTGEGGISSYHFEPGGDLIFQLGTGYFGARDADGRFSPDLFRDLTSHHAVKMIELKLSQGAKPGHGGILPGRKVTPEIAKIRNIDPWQTVVSPPFHTAFNTPEGLLEFIASLRELSGGKPVGFKLCIGRKSEFIAICKAMVKTGIKPDFISIDGGEGGTGAAPLEFTNSVGMPFREGLAFAVDCLRGFSLKNEIKVIAAGKIITGFHIYRALCLGADTAYSARAMMMALGCIQALECNKNTCPTGVATQDPELTSGLVVSDKNIRVANYHRETVEAFVELQAATGIDNHQYLDRSMVNRRVSMHEARRYDEFYPDMPEGCLLDRSDVPASWQKHWDDARADSFGINTVTNI